MRSSSISESDGGFILDIRSEGGTALVKCNGRLVFGQTDKLKNRVKDLLPQSTRIVIDLSEVDYMDSTGLGTVLYLYFCAKTSHSELQLVNLAPRVRQLFGITNILSLFEPCGEHNIRIT